MSGIIKVGLYNCEPSSTEDLRNKIGSLNYVRLSAEVGSPEELANLMVAEQPSLLFFHLDPDPGAVLTVIEDVSQRYSGLAMIALSHETDPEAILAPIRAGCDQFVCEPIDEADLASAVSRVASKRLLAGTKSRCICVTSASGGAGVTSIACNLAMEIAFLTRKVCGLVDLDLQFGDVAVSFDSEPKYTLHDVAVAGSDLDRTILEDVLTVLPSNVALLARPTMIEQCEHVSSDAIHRALELLGSIHENIVVDLPRRIDPYSFAALGQADLILVVCQLLVPSIRNTNRYLEALVKLGIPAERIQLVVNRSDSTGGRVTIKDLESLTHKSVFACIPSDYRFVAESLDIGQPIASTDLNNPVRREIRKMAGRIVGSSATAPTEEGTRRGLFGRRRSR